MRTGRFLIIGSGIIGASVAYKLRLRYPLCEINMMDNCGIATKQTSRSSNVLHTGVLSSNLNTRNICQKAYQSLPRLIKKLNVKSKKITKEVHHHNRIDHKKLHLSNLQESIGLISYDTHLVAYEDLCSKLIERAGVSFIQKKFRIDTPVNSYDGIFVCAGVDTLNILKSLGLKLKYENILISGKYYYFKTDSDVPAIYYKQDSKLPFLGVHITPTFDGNFKIGPDSRFSLKNFIPSSGVFTRLKFLLNHFEFFFTSFEESLSYFSFLRKAPESIDFMTGIKPYKKTKGTRALLIDKQCNIINEFKCVNKGNIYSVINTGSPAATCCEQLAELLVLNFVKNNERKNTSVHN